MSKIEREQVHIFYSHHKVKFDLSKLDKNCNSFVDYNGNRWVRTFNILKKIAILQTQQNTTLIELCVWINEYSKDFLSISTEGEKEAKKGRRNILTFSAKEKKDLMNIRKSVQEDMTKDDFEEEDVLKNFDLEEKEANNKNYDDDDDLMQASESENEEVEIEPSDNVKKIEKVQKVKEKSILELSLEDIEGANPEVQNKNVVALSLEEQEDVEVESLHSSYVYNPRFTATLKEDEKNMENFQEHLVKHTQHVKNQKKTENSYSEVIKSIKRGTRKAPVYKKTERAAISLRTRSSSRKNN